MLIIKRQEIPSITTISVDNKLYELGILKDFRKHPVLAQYMPENARLSMSWIHLDKAQILHTHQHPTLSMIIVTEGKVETMGAHHGCAEAGDIILVPPNTPHGFIGRGKNGLWGLSIQFEGTGLYEDVSTPRVNFIKNDFNQEN